MNYNHETFQTQPVSYDAGKIGGFQLRSHLKQKSYLCPLNNDSNQVYVSSLPKRKRQILTIINPETGDDIFSEIGKEKTSTSVEENSQQNDPSKNDNEKCVDSTDNTHLDKTSQGANAGLPTASNSGSKKTSLSPCMENVNNNRATLQSNILTDPNNFAANKMLHYGLNGLAKPPDSFDPTILPHKFNNSLSGFHNMYYNHGYYPSSDHLPHYQNLQPPPSQHFSQQPYLYSYRNPPYYNSDVCYYPPMTAQGNNALMRAQLKRSNVGSSEKISENSSNESLAESKESKEASQEDASDTSIHPSNSQDNIDKDITKPFESDDKTKQQSEDSTKTSENLDLACEEKNDSSDKSDDVPDVTPAKQDSMEPDNHNDTASPSTDDSDASQTPPKHLDPNAKSFIFNGILYPPVNYVPECNHIRRYSNTGYNVDFVENERWNRKGSDKGHALLGGVTSTPKLVRSESEGDGVGKGASRSSEEMSRRNKSGRIQYSRDFLLNLQYEPDSLKIPKDPISYPEIIQTGLHPHHMRIRMNKQQQCLDFNHSHFHNNNNHHHFNPSQSDKYKQQQHSQQQQVQQQQQEGNIPCIRSTSISMPSIIDTSSSLSHKIPQLNNHALMMMLNNNIQQHGRHIKGKSFQQQQQQQLQQQLQQQQQQLPRKIIQVSLEKNVQLHQSNNAWKPSQKPSTTNIITPNTNTTDPIQPDETTILDLYKKVRSILNKLTPQKFDTLIKQVHDLSINTEEKLKGCIKLIFEKAIGEPSFSLAYAKMAKSLNNLKVHIDEQPGETVTFRKLLLNQCQREFEKDNVEQQDLEKMTILIQKATSEKDRQQLIEAKKEAEKISKRRSLGNIRFIGELFRLRMLTVSIMYECISRLLRSSADEDNLECLCRLLSTIGYDLENTNSQSKQRLDAVFEELKVLAGRRDLSSRVRFMLQDALELRQNCWVPRRDDNQPKTIEQIHREAELEQRSCHFPVEKRSPISLQRHPVPIQKRVSLDQHRVDGKNLSGKGRMLQASKEDVVRSGGARAVVGCGSYEKATTVLNHAVDALASNSTFMFRGSASDIHNHSDKIPKVQPRNKTLEHKTPRKDNGSAMLVAKSLSGSISVDSFVTGAGCKERKLATHNAA